MYIKTKQGCTLLPFSILKVIESIVDIYNFLILLPIHSMSFAHNQHLSVLEFFH